MSSTSVTQTQHPLFPALDDKATVQVHALSAGHLTLPGRHPASDAPRNTVPSLSFLVQHVDFESGKRTRILFDLGLRRDSSRPSDPTPTDPDVVKSLAAGGLTPNDIDYVILSHLHRNHIGDPSAFPHSTFITGPDSLRHSHPDRALPPAPRTIELPSPASGAAPPFGAWRPCPARLLPHTLDVFADSSLLVVDAPPARLVLLARTGPGRLVCLAGDAGDDGGPTCGGDADDVAAAAAETAGRLRRLREELGVEVVGAHDGAWERGNGGRFWGAEVEEGME
ncbi:Metallo-hydrolase/oxidoreductase [Neofusicoccum parvum]|nr:Metallo-hydrolase/oxidoreductase [Neofusicoccum parvum]